jgi:adenine-specific DNA-methyltransferase
MASDRNIDSVADVFCGTAAVSQALSAAGCRVVASDHLRLCVVLAEAALLAPAQPAFLGLRGEILRAGGTSWYESALAALQREPPKAGFIHATYSPASAASGEHERRYFTADNAARIDTIRSRIEEWSSRLTRGERSVLLRDLVVAANRVSNTAGTYGCFLKEWKPRALQPLQLVTCVGMHGGRGHEVFHRDATQAAHTQDVDALYLDPPYTKRQYAAYYHVLETIVVGDRPRVDGVTGLRPWKERDSDFCHRRRAPQALRDLIRGVNVAKLFLSYSDDGHIEHETIIEILRSRGKVRWWEQPTRRYRSSSLRQQRAVVHERLYALALS